VLKEEDQQVYRKSLEEQDFDAALFAFSAPPLPYDFTTLFSSSSWPEGMNYMGFRNEEADSLIAQSRETPNAQRRKVMVDRVQEILYSELPCLYLYYPTRKIVVSKRFTKGAELYDIFPHIYLNNLQGEPVEKE
jgi:peptide/nickel transport system substrate-binding protein